MQHDLRSIDMSFCKELNELRAIDMSLCEERHVAVVKNDNNS
jgi:hypothetical protein